MVVVREQLSIVAVIESVLSELKDISSLKQEQRTIMNAFLDGNNVFALLPCPD